MAPFGRRKSVVQVQQSQKEQEKETRRRNRLSKPLTNKTSGGVSPESIHPSRDQIPTSPGLAQIGPLSSHPSNPSFRHQVRNEFFGVDSASPEQLKSNSSLSVAQIVRKLDSGSAITSESGEPPLSPLRSRKGKSMVFRRLSAQNSSTLGRNASSERVDSFKNESVPSTTPNSSVDHIADSPSVPPSRRSSFTPGTATRKASARDMEDVAVKRQSIIHEAEEKSVVSVDLLDIRPPPITRLGERAGTPAEFGYSHLGGFSMGSLQVMNGRASPAPSELSKISRHLLTIPKRPRDVSSEYGDADVNVDDSPIHGSNASHQKSVTTEKCRDFRWGSTYIVTDNDDGEELDARTRIPLDMEDDDASIIAKEYISELPASPYSEIEPRSLFGSIRSSSDGSLQHSRSTRSLQRSTSSDSCRGDTSSISSIDGSLSPSSVVRRPSLKADIVTPQKTNTDFHELESVSKETTGVPPVVDPGRNREEALYLSVEPEIEKEVALIRPRQPIEKYDSGYTSAYSVRSWTSDTLALPEQSKIESSSMSRRTQGYPVAEKTDLQHRHSILKTHKTSLDLPTFDNLQSNLTLQTSVSEIPEPQLAEAKPVKTRKKLQKKRPQSQPPARIAVTRVSSFELESIPAIPAHVQENLRIRSQEVPELEQTYSRLNKDASNSTISLQIRDIRFPSPPPEQPVDQKRTRSRSRRRSWVARQPESSSKPMPSEITPGHALAIINDFGTVVTSLGTSPYDLAHEGMYSSQRTNAYNMSSLAPRPRSMMDDNAALQMAKFRRRLTQDHDSTPERRPSFNDRGGIPGKSFRPASFAGDAPPITMEMLQTVYRTSSLQRQHSLKEAPDSSPPPPPPHSPRPAYVEYQEDYSDMVWSPTVRDDSPPPPPPPSHSPRPRDITPDPWAAQAAAWRARRQSAGLALATRYTDDIGTKKNPQAADEPLYPVIPPRPRHQPSRSSQYGVQNPMSIQQPTHARNYDGPPGDYEQYHQKGIRSHYVINHDEDDSWAASLTYEPHCQKNNSVHDHHRGRMESAHGYPRYDTRIESGNRSPRPRSQAASIRSHASSLAEELHPADIERPHPAPEFGRYSGGMGYGYERNNGFGGSAGTRSISGKADASRVGVPLRASHGVDLGDVPVAQFMRV